MSSWWIHTRNLWALIVIACGVCITILDWYYTDVEELQLLENTQPDKDGDIGQHGVNFGMNQAKKNVFGDNKTKKEAKLDQPKKASNDPMFVIDNKNNTYNNPSGNDGGKPGLAAPLY